MNEQLIDKNEELLKECDQWAVSYKLLQENSQQQLFNFEKIKEN